jgi:hypothetical protein
MIQGDRLLWEAIEKKILREDVEKKNFFVGGRWRVLEDVEKKKFCRRTLKKKIVGGRGRTLKK